MTRYGNLHGIQMEVLRVLLVTLFILTLKSSVISGLNKIRVKRHDGYYGLRKNLEQSMAFKEQAGLRAKEKEPEWVEQPLDHFDENNNQTWWMRYYSNMNFWKPGGPLIIFIGGEFNITAAYIYGGITYDFASEWDGAMFATEHRYYGESIPIEDDFTYLNAEQGLADLVTFIKTLKSNPDFATSKVVVIGGSYPGILATRLRQFHPDVVDAVVASSTPLLAKVDFYEFIESVEKAYEKYGTPNCLETIAKVFHDYEKCFKDPECVKGLIIEYNLCEDTDLTKRKHQFTFIATQSFKYDNMIQYGTVDTIKKKCEKIENGLLNTCNTNDTNKKLFAKIGVDSDAEEDSEECVSVDFFEMAESWNEAWTYQTCNEFGYFVTTFSENQIYGNKMPLKGFLEVCSINFGITDVHQRVRRNNQRYGALRPNVTQVVFTNGGLDPWHTLGLTESFDDVVPVIFIPEAGHTKDLATLSDNDSVALLEARKLTKSYIKDWIKL